MKDGNEGWLGAYVKVEMIVMVQNGRVGGCRNLKLYTKQEQYFAGDSRRTILRGRLRLNPEVERFAVSSRRGRKLNLVHRDFSIYFQREHKV